MSGSVTFGDLKLSVATRAAVEIVKAPAQTYKYNFPDVTVVNMGVGRFLATARRLWALKKDDATHLVPLPPPTPVPSPAPAAPAAPPAPPPRPPRRLVVRGMMIDADVVKVPGYSEGKKAKGGHSVAKQDGDYVTDAAYQGRRALHWLLWDVRDATDEAAPYGWVADNDTDGALRSAVTAFLNSPSFGPAVFPLPGDIHLVTGGPPCQVRLRACHTHLFLC